MRLLRVTAFGTGLVYLTWRLVFTHEGANPVMFFLLLAAEAFGFVRLHMQTSLFGRVRPPTRTPETTLAPDADVVVVVTDEPASEVRAAVLSARLIQGYNDIRIVDRDDRPDVAQLASRLRIPRVVGGREADLGELVNQALSECPSLFTLLMPADLVVMPDILEVTAGAFTDSEVGVVHCRVENTNALDAVDFGGYGEHRRRDELMLSTLDDAGALPWWPGMGVVRRSALTEIGGVSAGRDAFTMATGARLQEAGWRVSDVPVVVGRRLAPWNDDRHLHRWARDLHERLTVLVDKDAPVRHAHSTRLSRRVYRAADLHVGRSIQRLVMVGVLFASIYGSSLPLVAEPFVLLGLWGTWQASSLAYRRTAQAPIGFVSWITNDLRLFATDLVVAARALPGKALGVDLVDPAPGRLLRRVVLTALQFGLSATLLVFGTGLLRPNHGDFATLVLLSISAWLLIVTVQARSGVKLRQLRQNFRTMAPLEVLGGDGGFEVVGLSPFGLDVVSTRRLRPSQKFRIMFGLPQVDGPDRPFEVSVAVRRTTRDGARNLAYLRFSHLSDHEVDQITEYCAVVAGHQELRREPESEASEPLRAALVDAWTSDAPSAPTGSLLGSRVGARAAKGNGL